MYHCLLIDDEPHMLDALSEFIHNTELLQLKHTAYNGTQALNLLALHNYDIVFCDINMPDVNGMDIVKAYKDKSLFIMCTGFPEYAVQSFELAVVDFLVKPILYPRFMQAVQKAIALLQSKKIPDTTIDHFFLKNSNKSAIERVAYTDILYIEGNKNYISFVLKNKKMLSNQSLKDMETKLPPDKFIRVHSSYIIPIAIIEKIEANSLQLNGVDIPIPLGASYKEQVLAKLRIK
jgi:two-component system, LytTR family, response regulator